MFLLLLLATVQIFFIFDKLLLKFGHGEEKRREGRGEGRGRRGPWDSPELTAPVSACNNLFIQG